jgi:RNA polymerase sigma factor (sigma-70 family)
MPLIHNINDNENPLWASFRQGNTDAFSSIIKLHYNDLYSYGICFTKDTYLLKDSIQDIFLTLWKNRATIGITSQIKFYLLKSLRRKLAENLHANKRYTLKPETDFENLFDFQLNKEDAIVEEENRLQVSENLRAAIKKLSKRQQEIIYLRFYLDIGFDEIAGTMNLNHQSVYNLLHNAINRLKEINHLKNNPPQKGISELTIFIGLLANLQ